MRVFRELSMNTGISGNSGALHAMTRDFWMACIAYPSYPAYPAYCSRLAMKQKRNRNDIFAKKWETDLQFSKIRL